jgi:XTP/dITP diphosphohydrolase
LKGLLVALLVELVGFFFLEFQLIVSDTSDTFEGICKGQITSNQKGSEGFGYDPIFIPDGSSKCFAEMTLEEKNCYSHRKKAMQQLLAFFNTQQK